MASAAINFGLAILVLSLFSILKKQPSNAPIYYARRLSLNHQTHVDHSRFFSPSRYLPSLSWISRAFRVPESEILHASGLDALVVIRLFKFGVKFSVVCTVVGLAVLIPVNYNGQDELNISYRSMDVFTISNLNRGSDREILILWNYIGVLVGICFQRFLYLELLLWIHFACLWLISLYALYLLYTEYNEILIKRIQQLRHIKDRPDQFTVLVREIPLCTEHKAQACSADHFFSKYYPRDYHSYQILYNGKDVEELMAKSIARKINKLKERSAMKQKNRGHFLLDKSDRDEAKLALQEEKFEDLRLKINQLQCKNALKQKELPIAFVTFKSRSAATLVAQSQQHSHPLSWITSMAPEPRDVSWRNLVIPYRFLPLCRLGDIKARTT